MIVATDSQHILLYDCIMKAVQYLYINTLVIMYLYIVALHCCSAGTVHEFRVVTLSPLFSKPWPFVGDSKVSHSAQNLGTPAAGPLLMIDPPFGTRSRA